MSASALQRSVATLRVRLAGAEPTDRQLLECFLREQDQDAFAALVARHQRPVLSALRKVLREPADVEDAFQATFLVLLRKAKQVNWLAGLGTWLYAVAHRVAVHSRAASARRAFLRTSPPAAEAGPDLSCDEACLILHKELDRLPDRFRLPLLLCYLEGKSRDEAARQLGVPLSTVKGRLEQGRDMLRKRLLRRGVTLGVGLLGAMAATPALAAGLVERTVAAAAGAAAPGAVALVRDVTASAVLSRVALTALLALMAVLPLCGAFAPGQSAPDTPRPAAPADEGAALTGRVLDPAGKPVADAAVRLRRSGAAAKDAAVTRTDRDGRFKLSAPGLTEATLTARAPGLGADWLRVRPADAGRELTLRLPADDIAIEGRVRDLEGQPVADAEVRVENVGKPVAENLDAYLKAWQDPERVLASGARLLHEMAGGDVLDSPRLRTDRQGRFRLAGVGRDRKVTLQIRAKGIATLFVDAVTRKELAGKYPWGLQPAKFELLASPAKVIHGTVKEAGTGKPLAGVRVYGQRETTVTDNQGRYRLDGVEKSAVYIVSIRGKGHFGSLKDVKDTAALDPIEVNFELRPGVFVEGRVVERGTGLPVRADVVYAARPDNPAVKSVPGDFQRDWAESGADGAFRLLVLPGRGYLTVQAHDNRFGRVAPPGWKGLPIDAVPHGVQPQYNHATVEVSIDPDRPESLKRTIDLDPGAAVAGEVLDADGKPLANALAFGLTAVPDPGSRIFPRQPRFGPAPPARLPSSRFTAAGITQPRHLVFVHPEKKLGKVVKVNGDEKGPISVRLEPWAAVAGTAMAAKGAPANGYSVTAGVSRSYADYRDYPIELLDTLPPPYRSRRSEVVWLKASPVGDDGTFRVEGLIPGLKFDLFFAEGSLERERRPNYHITGMNKPLEAGKTTDVGRVAATRSE